jgi:molybdopterin converting factor small subunit
VQKYVSKKLALSKPAGMSTTSTATHPKTPVPKQNNRNAVTTPAVPATPAASSSTVAAKAATDKKASKPPKTPKPSSLATVQIAGSTKKEKQLTTAEKKKKTVAVNRQDLKRLIKAIEGGDEVAFHQIVSMPGFNSNTMIEGQLFEAKFQWCPLHCAAFNGRLRFVQELLERYDAEVDKEDGWLGGTALAWAAYGDQQECAKYLVERGADRSKKNRHGQSAIDLVPVPEDPKWHGVLVEQPKKKKSTAVKPGVNPMAKIKTIFDKLVRLKDET